MKDTNRLEYGIELLDTICRGLQTTLSVDKIIHIILTGLTAGASLGFSRAAIFFLGEDGVLKEGRGIGPYDRDEAGKIWVQLNNLDVELKEMFENSHRQTLESQRFPVEIRSITIDTSNLDPDSPLKRVIAGDKEELIVLKGDERFSLPREFHNFAKYASEIVVGPIKISGKISAIVFADNAFHYRNITQETLNFLSIILNQAGLALSNAFAYEHIKQNLNQVQQLNEKLRQVREELLNSERLAATGKIATYLAHELRNPLATMAGFAQQILQICKERHSDASDAIIIRNTRIIINEIRRLELVMNNILRFSIKQPTKKQQVNLYNLVSELMEVLSINIEDSRVNLSIQIPENITVYADKVQLSEVFYNLVHNSLESISPGGLIIIKAGETDQDVWVDISDNGCGIPQDTLNKLFQPFFTTKARGVGLGLHIVKTIVEQNHGGKINIVSEPDRGTTIHFTIPKKEEDGEKNTVNRG